MLPLPLPVIHSPVRELFDPRVWEYWAILLAIAAMVWIGAIAAQAEDQRRSRRKAQRQPPRRPPRQRAISYELQGKRQGQFPGQLPGQFQDQLSGQLPGRLPGKNPLGRGDRPQGIPGP